MNHWLAILFFISGAVVAQECGQRLRDFQGCVEGWGEKNEPPPPPQPSRGMSDEELHRATEECFEE